jgi:hypothetical protein
LEFFGLKKYHLATLARSQNALFRCYVRIGGGDTTTCGPILEYYPFAGIQTQGPRVRRGDRLLFLWRRGAVVIASAKETEEPGLNTARVKGFQEGHAYECCCRC